jgi:hypothetical protein
MDSKNIEHGREESENEECMEEGDFSEMVYMMGIWWKPLKEQR